MIDKDKKEEGEIGEGVACSRHRKLGRSGREKETGTSRRERLEWEMGANTRREASEWRCKHCFAKAVKCLARAG